MDKRGGAIGAGYGAAGFAQVSCSLTGRVRPLVLQYSKKTEGWRLARNMLPMNSLLQLCCLTLIGYRSELQLLIVKHEIFYQFG